MIKIISPEGIYAMGNEQLVTGKDHINFNIKLNQWLMTVIGAWPLSLCKHKIHKIILHFAMTINILLIIFLVVPTTLALMLKKDSNVHERLYIGGPLAFLIATSTTGCILLASRNEIDLCIRHMKFDRDSIGGDPILAEEKILIGTSKLGRSLIAACALCLYVGLGSYNLLRPVVSKMTEIVDNVTVRATTYPIYRELFDPRDSPWFEIVQFFHAWGGFLMCTNQMTTNCFAAVCVMHACGQLKIITFRLKCLVNECDKGSTEISTDEFVVKRKFAAIVEKHLRVFDFIKRVEALLNKIYCIEFTGYTLVICFVVYYAMIEWSRQDNISAMTYAILIFTFSSNVFLPCYIGELLIEEFRNVGVATYMIDWYRLPSNEAKYLILMNAASNSTPKLTAGKFMDLSLITFGGVMKTSMAYLNMMLTLPE